EDPATICHFCQSSWAFFPLYPMLLKGISLLTGLGFKASALVCSLVVVALLAWQFYRLLCDEHTAPEKAFFKTLFLFSLPFHYYFFMYYTEALYLLLIILAFRCTGKNRIFPASLFLALLVLVRPNGIICLPALVLYWFEKQEQGFQF